MGMDVLTQLYCHLYITCQLHVSANNIFGHHQVGSPPRDCKTLMMVVGLVWSNESRSYAGGSVATGRASHARLVRDEDPD